MKRSVKKLETLRKIMITIATILTGIAFVIMIPATCPWLGWIVFAIAIGFWLIVGDLSEEISKRTRR